MRRKVIIISVILFLFLVGIITVYFAYKMVFTNNISSEAPSYIYIKTGSTYDGVIDILKKEHVVKDLKTFQWVSKVKDYPQRVKAGRYAVKQGMNNNELVNMLRSGRQEPVNFTFNNVRTKEQFVQKVSQQLETGYDDLLSLLDDDKELEKYNVNKENVLILFIPNTYQFWWNTSPDEFMQRMYKEYHTFWNQQRIQRAKDINLSPIEVSIMASIVEEENHRADEQARIAGVYINRLNRGMLLQADPTVKFALQDFGRKRLLYADLEIDSPYNTYKYMGLPPGPIRIPSPVSIDNVLNYEKHNYIFMCAKEDFSGYHNFAATSAQHAANARKYHDALNRNKIKK